jgi:retron-type reverse transcriptase
MKSDWKIDSTICTVEYIVERIGHNRRDESTYRRPIAALEDKIVQQAVVTVLNQIYEADFKGFSYGFRPGRSPHQALDA